MRRRHIFRLFRETRGHMRSQLLAAGSAWPWRGFSLPAPRVLGALASVSACDSRRGASATTQGLYLQIAEELAHREDSSRT